MARKKIDLNKGQTLLIIGNDTDAPVVINRINPHSDVYDGFELTVVLEKPSVAPAGENENTVTLSWLKEGLITSNLILRTVGNSPSVSHGQNSIIGPTYYESVDTYLNNCLCVVRFVYSTYYSKWIEVSRQYVSYS